MKLKTWGQINVFPGWFAGFDSHGLWVSDTSVGQSHVHPMNSLVIGLDQEIRNECGGQEGDDRVGI